MLKGLKSVGYILFIIIVIELVFRAWISISFGTSFFQPDLIKDYFYPELNFALEDNDKMKLLVLGGSVVYNSEVIVEVEGQQAICSFCNIKEQLPKEEYQVISLAQPGHNSLDSRYKFDYLNDYKFDFIFIYHGINDARANNWPQEDFDTLYRHVEFYDDLALVLEHSELPLLTSWFAVDWLRHTLRKKEKIYLPKEIFIGLLNGKPEKYLRNGNSIKTRKSFQSNLEYIIKLAAIKNEQVILSSYAWYLPDNYSIEAFKRGLLDYDQQIFPTELYGIPENVKRALIIHNELVYTLSQKHENLKYFDLNSRIPKSKEYFNDICHLNAKGCNIMMNSLNLTIREKDEKR